MHTALRRRHRTLFALAPLCALFATSCSSDAGPDWSLDNLDVGDGDLHEIDAFFPRGSVSPDGTLIAIANADEICLQPANGRRPECIELDESADEQSISWSDDGATLYFTANFVRAFHEPDVIALDTTSLDLDVLTDDRIDDGPLRDEDSDALTDVTPFAGPDGDVYFFRTEFQRGRDTDFELFRVGHGARDASDAEQVGSLDLPRGAFPLGPVRKLSDDRWMLGAFSPDGNGATIFLIDLEAEEISEVATDFDAPGLVDVTPDLALVVELQSSRGFETEYALIDLESGRDRAIDLDLDDDEILGGAGFSPDGTSLAFAVNSSTGSAEVVAVPIEDNRAVEDEVETLIDKREFDDLGSEEIDGISGIGQAREITWTANGMLLLDQNASLITFEITPNEK